MREHDDRTENWISDDEQSPNRYTMISRCIDTLRMNQTRMHN